MCHHVVSNCITGDQLETLFTVEQQREQVTAIMDTAVYGN